MTERVGFEPTEPFRVHYISNVANSTALAPFQTNFSIIEITQTKESAYIAKDNESFSCLFTFTFLLLPLF
jgi:hypothetical protein